MSDGIGRRTFVRKSPDENKCGPTEKQTIGADTDVVFWWERNGRHINRPHPWEKGRDRKKKRTVTV